MKVQQQGFSPPVCAESSQQSLLGSEQRQHHIEIDPEQRDHPNDCYYQEDGWHVPDVEQTLAQALERAEFLIVRSSTGQGVPLVSGFRIGYT
jgi:hypothetical protein